MSAPKLRISSGQKPGEHGLVVTYQVLLGVGDSLFWALYTLHHRPLIARVLEIRSEHARGADDIP